MARIDLTIKPQAEQLRILNDYLNRRMQHKAQDEVTLPQLVNRFRHNRCFTIKAKTLARKINLLFYNTLQSHESHS